MTDNFANLDHDNRSFSIFIKDISNIDSAIFDPSRGIVGNSWTADVTVQGQLDENGFVYDFSHVKSLARQIFATSIDHALIIPLGSNGVTFLGSDGNSESWRLETIEGKDTRVWEYTCPKGSIYPIDKPAIKLSTLEKEMNKILRHRLPQTVTHVNVCMRPEEIEKDAAHFRYTHGLPGHDGLCQRLFHGHRSRLEIRLDGQRNRQMEDFVISEYFNDGIIHITCPNQIVGGEFMVNQRLSQASGNLKIAYNGTLGRYESSMPTSRTFVVDQATSIETITATLAQLVKEKFQVSGIVEVACFEGINKGSIASV